jgi:hypothetical protein
MSKRTIVSHLLLALALTGFFTDAAFALTLPSKVEQKCLKKLGTLAIKLSGTVARETARCREDDIDGTLVGSCPNAANDAKIDVIGQKIIDAAVKSCKSVCSVSSQVECVADTLCPPLAIGANELCTAGAQNLPFDIASIGFPGANCAAVLAGDIDEPSDIGACTRALVELASADLIDAVYGSINNASSASPVALSCLSSASKATQKLLKTAAKGVSKCRNSINSGKVLGDPKACSKADAKVAGKIATAEQKVRDAVTASCSPAALAELDLCGAGVGAIATVTDAQNCFILAGREVADSSDVPAARLIAPVSVIDAAYPAPAVCGDNTVNQLPNPFLLLGEECDGTDDSECPGQCLPPGDTFECTCGDRPRMRAFSDDLATDSDAGWTGNSHDQLTADQSGFVVDLANCDCDAFTGADCTGSSTQPVCDVSGIQTPFCSWDTTQSIRCDTLGDNNNLDRDSDCKICDDFAVNAGASCTNSTQCQAQCYDSGGLPTGACDSQGDCAPGEVCRGRCDDTQRCIITANGGPLPVAAAGAAVCNVQRFRTGITGTRNLVTGENEMFFEVYSVTHLGELISRPCPVCGGYCVGGERDSGICEGRCETSGDPCRFDEDCPGIDEVCSTASPDCPDGFCELQLICGTLPGINNDVTEGKTCRIEFESPYFGTVSNDCQPSSGKNIGGEGFLVKHQPTGSEPKVLPFTHPCSATGFELFDCPCPAVGGQPTKPNACTPACNAAGPDFGVGCADGNTTGQGTTCVLGSNAGKLCDEDSDCPGGTCSDNPTHCTGDPLFERFPCTTNGDCGLGTCGDACAGGRCVPLCVPELGDPEDGICSAGPAIYTCNSAQYQFITCTQASAEAGCAATCSIAATPCDEVSDCPSGESCVGSCEHSRDCEAGVDGVVGNSDDIVGAGPCIAKDRGCNLDPIVIEGGDTLNGNGDNTNYLRSSIWCFSATTNPAINSTSGFPGPGTIRERGVGVINVDSIP